MVPQSPEGFWGKINPLARKKWVRKQLAPVNDQLSELDQVTAKNAQDIRDVDGRATAGINKAQSAADAANQLAAQAGDAASKAGSTAQGAQSHTDQLASTVSGLDNYRQATAIEITFHGAQATLSAEARQQLDTLAASLHSRGGYLLEIEGHGPKGSSVEASNQLSESVRRYLVTEHQVPVYRLHAVSLGKSTEEGKAARNGSVSIRLMENSLAAK